MSCTNGSSSRYTCVERGQRNTGTYRMYVKDTKTDAFVSPFHDIPLKCGDAFNMFVEIPRWTNAKMEINKEERLNPIKQDVKKGKLRYVNNVFPHHGYIWNYGALPQTWEDPNVEDKDAGGAKGDNDPLDACEIGSRVHKRGAVCQVKVLGALGLIDEGEADWKIIVIDVTDPMAEKLNDIDDVEKHLPGLLDATRDWFKIYKMPTGKDANKFAQNGTFLNREFALRCIEHASKSWETLISGGYEVTPEKQKGIALANTTEARCKHHCKTDDAARFMAESKEHVPEAAELDEDARKACETVFYYDRSKL